MESERHGKGPLALGAWRSKNTRPTHILGCMSSAIYLRDKLVLESEGHGKGPLALGAWRSKIRSLWPDVPRHARQSAGHPTCSRRTSECLGRLFRLSRNDRTCDGLSMCQSASSIEFLAATEGAAGYRQDVSQARCQSGKMSVRQDVSQARCQSGKMSVRKVLERCQ